MPASLLCVAGFRYMRLEASRINWRVSSVGRFGYIRVALQTASTIQAMPAANFSPHTGEHDD